MDLLEYARDYREELVLKPNRGYGGAGVAPRRGAVAERVGSAARRSARRAARSAPAVGRASGGDAARASLSRARRAGPHARGAVLRRHGFRADGSRPRHHRARLAEASRQRRAARRSRRRARRLSARGSRRARRARPCRPISRRKSCARPCSECAISTASIHLLEWDEETYRPRGAAEDRASQLAVLGALRHELLAGDRLGDLLAALAARAGSHGARAHRDRAARPLAAGRRRAAAESRRGLRRNALALPRGLGRGAPRRGLRRVPDSVRAAAQAHARAGARRSGLSDDLLRRAARRARARHAPRAPRPACCGRRARGCARSCRARGAHAPRTRSCCRAAVYHQGRAAAVLRRAASRHGLRLRARPPRPLDASVHDDGRRGRRAAHDSLDARTTRCARSSRRCTKAATRSTTRGCRASCTARCSPTRPSMGVHESQARLWENHVGRSAAFWRHYFAPLQRAFPDMLGGLDARGFHRAINVVAPGVDRVAADEATYNLHVLVRYELEIALLDGDLARQRPAGRLGRALPALPRRQRRRRRATAACRTCTGRSASSATSRPTRSATCTRRSSSTRTTRATTSTRSSRAATWARCAPGSPSSVYAHGAELAGRGAHRAHHGPYARRRAVLPAARAARRRARVTASVEHVREQAVGELRLEPRRLRRHQLAGIGDGHQLLHARRVQRERDRRAARLRTRCSSSAKPRTPPTKSMRASVRGSPMPKIGASRWSCSRLTSRLATGSARGTSSGRIFERYQRSPTIHRRTSPAAPANGRRAAPRRSNDSRMRASSASGDKPVQVARRRGCSRGCASRRAETRRRGRTRGSRRRAAAPLRRDARRGGRAMMAVRDVQRVERVECGAQRRDRSPAR